MLHSAGTTIKTCGAVESVSQVGLVVGGTKPRQGALQRLVGCIIRRHEGSKRLQGIDERRLLANPCGNRPQLLAAGVHVGISCHFEMKRRQPSQAFVLAPAVFASARQGKRASKIHGGLSLPTVPSLQQPASPMQFAQLCTKRLRDIAGLRDQFARASDFCLQLKQAASRVGELMRLNLAVSVAPYLGRTKRAGLGLLYLSGLLMENGKQIVPCRRGSLQPLFLRCGGRVGDRVFDGRK